MKNKESSSYQFLKVMLFLLQLLILSGVICLLLAVSSLKDYLSKGERGDINAMFILVLISLTIAATILITIKIIAKKREEQKNLPCKTGLFYWADRLF